MQHVWYEGLPGVDDAQPLDQGLLLVLEVQQAQKTLQPRVELQQYGSQQRSSCNVRLELTQTFKFKAEPLDEGFLLVLEVEQAQKAL